MQKPLFKSLIVVSILTVGVTGATTTLKAAEVADLNVSLLADKVQYHIKANISDILIQDILPKNENELREYLKEKMQPKLFDNNEQEITNFGSLNLQFTEPVIKAGNYAVRITFGGVGKGLESISDDFIVSIVSQVESPMPGLPTYPNIPVNDIDSPQPGLPVYPNIPAIYSYSVNAHNFSISLEDMSIKNIIKNAKAEASRTNKSTNELEVLPVAILNIKPAEEPYSKASAKFPMTVGKYNVTFAIANAQQVPYVSGGTDKIVKTVEMTVTDKTTPPVEQIWDYNIDARDFSISLKDMSEENILKGAEAKASKAATGVSTQDVEELPVVIQNIEKIKPAEEPYAKSEKVSIELPKTTGEYNVTFSTFATNGDKEEPYGVSNVKDAIKTIKMTVTDETTDPSNGKEETVDNNNSLANTGGHPVETVLAGLATMGGSLGLLFRKRK